MNVFFTPRTILPTAWRQAFPDARVQRPPTDSPPQNGELVWLHWSRQADPARVSSFAAGGAKVVVLSDQPNDDEGMAALAAGAVGYCNSHADANVLREVAQVVGHGGLWVGESLLTRMLTGVTARVAQLRPTGEAPATGLDQLTERERDIALRVAAGQNNKEIARALDLAERTVKAHLTAAFAKLGARDRLHLSLIVNRLV
jgi:DNA-binding NarL/FixJ family response regulator